MRGDWEKHSIFPCSLGYPRVLGFIYIGSSHAELQNQESGLEIDSSIGAWIHLMLKYFFFSLYFVFFGYKGSTVSSTLV